jgi:CRP-like cAMP-binding protein
MITESLAPILAEHPLLSGLERSYLELIVGCASNVRFNPGEFIFRAGQQANELYFVRNGRVSVETFSPQRGAITIETIGDGDLLGWSWLLPPFEWHFDARALTLIRAIVVDARCLRAKCESDTRFGYEMLKRVSQIIELRLEATRLQLLDLYVNT